MDKKYKKQFRKSGDKHNRVGTLIGIHDCNGTELKVGDKIKWGQYDGIILWNKDTESYWFLISSSKWYGDNEYDDDSYGKGFELRMDDGARMEMKLI